MMVWIFIFQMGNKLSSLSAFTAEQYQQHLEQLALMQKQQLEQIQLQQQANSTTTANSTHVSIPPSLQAVAQKLISPLVGDFNSFFFSRDRAWRIRWTRPALRSPPRPSSPPTNCWLSNPRRSWPWEAESTASSPPQVWQLSCRDSSFKLQKSTHVKKRCLKPRLILWQKQKSSRCRE